MDRLDDSHEVTTWPAPEPTRRAVARARRIRTNLPDIPPQHRTHVRFDGAAGMVGRSVTQPIAADRLTAACVAHELAQPISAITVLSDRLRRTIEKGTPLAPEAQMLLERLMLQAVQASVLFHRVRAAIRSEAPATRSCDLDTVARRAVALTADRSGAERVAVSVDAGEGPIPVRGDPVEIGQVLVNLINNAVDSLVADATAGATVRITITRTVEVAEVRVEDNGPGLPAADPEVLFAPFYTTKPDGLGVGLALCRQLVEKVGGCIWAEPASGHGAAFVFTLPRIE